MRYVFLSFLFGLLFYMASQPKNFLSIHVGNFTHCEVTKETDNQAEAECYVPGYTYLPSKEAEL